MNQKRIEQEYQDFKNALERLKEALEKDATQESVFVDGTIQRFEFTFEQAWKLAKVVLKYQGIEANTPRSAIKEAYRANLIDDGDGWINMLEDRNKTSHIYDEEEALKIYEKIRDCHYRLFRELESSISKRTKKLG